MNEKQIRRHSQRVAQQWAGTLFSPPLPQNPPAYNAKALRKSLQVYTTRNNWRAYSDWLANMLLFFFGQYAVIASPLLLKPLGGLIAAMAAVRLFFLAHDAGHGLLSHFKPLNAWLGRLAFLPSLTAYQSWVFSHNQHHNYANSIPSDLWAPLPPDRYRTLNPWQRGLYRLYRSPCGVGLYYLVEVWWQYFYYPSPKQFGNDLARRLLPDALLAIGFSVAWPLLLYGLAAQTGQAYMPLWLAGFILPLALTNTVIGFVSYLHHTHPKVNWQQQPMGAAYLSAPPSLMATVHIRFPAWLSGGLHYIMEHPAHHLCPGIPYHQLQAAQRQLEVLVPDIIVVQDFSWRWYAECTRICKLYDFENRCWLGFDGQRLN
ncbi:fatty acid desaturase family protein [Methylovulum psychrotolerans]|uniref:Fatty acid desaturase n=1 Tax=Methylovulum psychrotolerans TaxID=1704499 RepID=A0A1Z4BZE8_9GAMM|nr:fatty acid desaturase [Methylovulum psychrotolerans]ASF46658.1 fatty acid desaturase [Methylovulum psychrotolerans]